MKNIFIVLSFLFLAVPVLADDGLKPEPLDQSIQEYKNFWKTDTPDPMNHEIWKLYVYYTLTPNGGLNRTPETLVTGLTPDHKSHRYVYLRINQLYNFLRPMPKRGDVIVVEGRVLDHFRSRVTSYMKKDRVLGALYMYTENAAALPNEHFAPLTAGKMVESEEAVDSSPVVPSSTPVPAVLGQQGASIR